MRIEFGQHGDEPLLDMRGHRLASRRRTPCFQRRENRAMLGDGGLQVFVIACQSAEAADQATVASNVVAQSTVARGFRDGIVEL